MIAVIDYGMGNLGSVYNALKSLGGEIKVTQKGSDLRKADKIVLPGVGAFRDAMAGLTGLNLIEPLKEEIAQKKIYLGICLGFELLFEKSEEGGGSNGFGILKGDVVRFRNRGPASSSSRGKTTLKVPHMGWNQVRIKNKSCPLFNGIEDEAFFYFVHSYYVRPSDDSIIAAVTDYGVEFASMVWRDNIYATQYHPEKSQSIGLKLLENFIKL